MKIRFTIDYRTQWGESLYISGNALALGAGDGAKALRMHTDGVGLWTAAAEVDDVADGCLEYGYIVRSESGSERKEWGGNCHRLQIGGAQSYEVFDAWVDCPADKPFYSAAFTRCINKRKTPDAYVTPRAGNLTLSAEAPTVEPSQVLAVCGAGDALGDWNPKGALRMSDAEFPLWKLNIDLSKAKLPLEFKFVLLDKESGELLAWENGDNRHIITKPESIKTAMIVSGMHFNDPRAPWRGAGVAIPVFSVRTVNDFGVGDFYSLIKMVDWAVATGQKFLQILPINDTTMTHTWTDSYPYNACTTFGLHPMYLHIQELGRLKDVHRQKYFDDLAQELNSLPTVDYERVNEAKNQFTAEIFAQEGSKTLKSVEFTEFLLKNSYWLKPYAAFCVLRDKFRTPDFARWGEYANYKPEIADRVYAENTDKMNLVYFTQYHLDRQMRRVHDYASARGVAFKGDIPIGISRDSADAWINPRLFNMDSQAGAPPDDFSVLGQNWGFPTYNWEEMWNDHFAWWKARFRKMAEYFDAYRIDHVLGFFRIWQIPMSAVHGLLGTFNPALPYSIDELRANYDFWLDVDLQTRPYIMDSFLNDFFGDYADEAREHFLVSLGHGRYGFRSEFDTQRKVADYFAHQEKNEKNTRLCDGLLGLHEQVLFIEDPVEEGMYHPRISAQYTYIYNHLTDYEKWCFNRLYNDFYYHRHNDFWYGKAMWKLPPLIDATSMLTCAEDLGMIPACVPAVMDKLHILSLEIQRMPKNPEHKFGLPWEYPYLSVCTTSTHDMGGIRQWWEDNPQLAQQFYNEMLHQPGKAPEKAEPWICDRILMMNLQSPSMLAIIPLQDWLSVSPDLRRSDPREEEINVPSNPRHYWRYRMHLNVEELIAAETFNRDLADRIRNAGR
ncbi:MAG: 4-alpha-glucanotransferase [Muribaculum sp.]|nr:4-alpha-glucanotransferase [Muribaculaceae bacterium]MCM1081203.1 4-alpha-glucanotransferase [Muribaculum sp.]